ncbi:MAG: metal ABC transporter substrate-binding protein [Roseburia sp.]|nr:metal ABC transporter substrate-binding protein [Roseburia sp.]
MRRFLLLVWVQTLLALGLCGCAGSRELPAEDGKINIVCTTFPQYDWVRTLISGREERFSLTLLTERGGDLHNYQPSARDIARISECDLLIYVGGESDAWVEEVLREAANPEMRVLNMMEAVASELKEETHGHEGGHEPVSPAHEETEYDEHVWLSLNNARQLVAALNNTLAALDADGAELYGRNAEIYLAALASLDARYRETVDAAVTDTLVFADRFPFRYMVEDYGLTCFAAFEGCSAETGVSFETVALLSERLDSLGLDAVLVTESSDKRIARVIIENTAAGNQEILVMDSMQSVSRKELEGGITYLSVMEENLEVLRTALR